MKRLPRHVFLFCLITSLILWVWVTPSGQASANGGTVTAYGWNAYGGDTGLAEGPVSIEIPSGELRLIKSVADDTFDFMSGGDFVEEAWYTISYSDGNSCLYTIDCLTGEYTLIGSTGVGMLTGFTYDRATQTAYVASSTELYTIDLDTAQVTLVGTIAPGIIIGIAADAAGHLYGLNIFDDCLYRIDKTTGQGTDVGNTGLDLNYAQDIAFDRDNDILYGALYVNGVGGGLYQINVDNGSVTKLADYGVEIDALAIPYTVVKYSVALSSSPSAGGTVTGGGEYGKFATVTVSAAANEGYEFVNWTEDGVEVSTDPDYTFTAEKDRNLVANFKLSAVPVSGVSLNWSALSLSVDGTFQLRATVAPEEATNKNVRWSCSDESVATVNEDGLVTAVGPGRALVMVTTEDGHFTAGCTITVTAAPGSDSGLEADTSKLKNELPRTSTSPALFLSLGAVLTAGGLVLLRKKR